MTSSATQAIARTSAKAKQVRQHFRRRKFRQMVFESLEERRVLSTFPAPVDSWEQAEFRNGEVLVKFNAGITQQMGTAAIFQTVGGTVTQYWSELNMHYVRLPQFSLGDDPRGNTILAAAELHGLDIAEYAEPNLIRHSSVVPSDPLFFDQWGLNNVGQPTPYPPFAGGTFDADIDAVEAWDTITGDPDTIVAIVDTGTDYTHPDLVDNIWINPNEQADGFDNDGNGFIDDVVGWDSGEVDNDPQDPDGHGTHVAGIAGAVGDNSLGVAGVSWNNKLMILKGTDDTGTFPVSGIVGAQAYITRMKVQFGLNIVASNNSYGALGTAAFSFAEFDAIRLATQAGIAFIAAAGNDGTNTDAPTTPHYPSSYNLPGIISVAATDRDDQLIGFSNRGFFSVDLGAPGVEILSTWPESLPRTGQPPAPNVPPIGYAWLDGTSMASPMVAGAYGLIKAFDPTLTVAQVKNILLTSVDLLPSLRNVSVSGGRLNLKKALDAIPVNEFSGTVFLDRDGDGRFDGSEPGQSGWTVYVDLNNNKILDGGEPATVSQADGTYQLRAKLSSGTYFIREVPQQGFIQTKPNAASDFAYRVTLTGPLDQVSNLDFGNKPIPGSVEGEKYNDLNGNGQRDAGEPGVKGIVIYVDINGDGKIGIGEPGAITDVNGRFRIDNVPPGVYTVREVYQPGIVQTEPDPTLPAGGGIPNVLVVGGEITSGLVFGNRAAFDYGDAPNSYRTLKADNGPVHGILTGFFLGAGVDDEADGQPLEPNATGDDVNQTDDEDGIAFLSPLTPGELASVAVTVSSSTYGAGVLAGWIDFDNDGDFLDGGEQVFTDVRLRTGTHLLTFLVPANAQVGDLFARFRYSTQTGLGPIGPAIAGEVEDYVTGAASSVPFAKDDFFVTDQDTTFADNAIFVMANDVPALSGLPLSIAAFDALTVQGGQVQVDDNGTAGDTTDDFLRYQPAPGYFGPDSFTYSVTDGVNTSNTATVAITVNFVPTDPVAVDDTFDLTLGSGAQILDVLANDIAGTGGALSLIPASFTTAAGGTVVITPTTLTYTPPSSGSGVTSDTFDYTVRDPALKTDTAQVWIQFGGPVAGVHKIEIEYRLFDKDGNELSDGAIVPLGEIVEVRAFTDDLRAPFNDPISGLLANGALAAYADMLYNRNALRVKADPSNPFGVDITFGPRYDSGSAVKSVSTGIPGLVDETGSTTGSLTLGIPSGADPLLLYRLKFETIAVGSNLQFKANPADVTPGRDVVANNAAGSPEAVPDSEVFLDSSPIFSIVGSTEGEGTNMRNPLDVDVDGFVAPIDALLVVSHLNRFGAGPYNPSLFASGGQLAQYYVDVNYDGFVSAIDIKLVIDYLNSHAPEGFGGEGEGPSAEGEGGDGLGFAFAATTSTASSSSTTGSSDDGEQASGYADSVDLLLGDERFDRPTQGTTALSDDELDDREENDEFFLELGSAIE